MIKHTVKYIDFDENEVEKDFWFNLNEGDLITIQMSKKQGFFEMLDIAIKNEDPTIVMEAFQKVLIGGVGRREGELFIKDEEARNQLVYTNAYSALLVWMLANPLEARAFIDGMLPAGAQAAVKDSRDELIAKFQAKTEEMAVTELSLDTEPNAFGGTVEVVETTPEHEVVPMMSTETPDFSSMTPEQFEEWQRNRA
jgi:hypothetical protein